MPSLTDSWDSQYSYQDTTSVPAADTGKTNDQIEKENLERNTKAAINKSRQIKKEQQAAKAKGRTKKNRETWNPAALVGQTVLKTAQAPFDALSNAVSPTVAAAGEFVDKNLYGIKDTQQLAKRKRQRLGQPTQAEKAKLAKEDKQRQADLGFKPVVETAKFILKGTGAGIIEDYGSQLIKAGQEGMARVGEVIGKPVAPEQDPRSDRYIKAQMDFGLTPEDPMMAKAAELMKLINGARFLGRVAPGVGPDAGKMKQLMRSGGLDFFAGFIHADTTKKGGPTLATRLEEALPPNLKQFVPQALMADPEFDNEARYRIAAGLEDMGLGKLAEAIGAAFKALDIFQVAKKTTSKVFGKKTTAELVDESVATLNKELDKTAAKAAGKEAEESIRWDDVNQLRRDEVLNKIDDLKARQTDPWEDANELKKQLDDANDQLKDIDNIIADGINGTPQGSRSTARVEIAADVGRFEIPEAILQNRVWMTDAATKRANMTAGWRSKIDEALELVNDKDMMDALYRRYKQSEVKQILKAIDKTVLDGYQDVLNTAKSPEEVRDALLNTFRNEGQTFTGEVGTEQLKSKAVVVTQAMMRRLSEKAGNIGQDALHSEANGITGGNHFDRMVDQVAGMVMLRKEAWSLEAGRRLALGKRWQQAMDEVSAEGADEASNVLTSKMLRKWADHVKYLMRTGDPAARDEARMMSLAMALSGGDPAKTIDFAGTVVKYAGKKTLGMFYNNILSGTKTLIRNMAGTMRLVLYPTQIGLQGLIEGNDMFIGAAGAGYAALFNSSLEAAQVAGKTFRSGVPASWSAASVITKVESNAMLDGLEMAATNDTQRMIAGHLRWLDSWAAWTELPSRLMMSSDDYIRTVAVRQKISMDAFKYASDRGAKDFGMNLEHAMIAMGRGVDSRSGQITDKALKEYGDTMTFTNDPGFYAKKLEELVSGGPENKIPIGRFIMPFIRTPANIMGYQLSFTPLIGKFMGGYREALKSGDEMALAELRGRESVGSLLLSLGYSMGTSGNVTGNAPFDANERERWRQQGIQPRSVKVGNTWVSYAWFDPLSNWVAAAADLGHLSRYGDIEDFNQLATALTYAIAGSFTEKSYLANLDGISVILNPQDGFKKLTGGSNIPGNPNNFMDTMASAGLNMANNLVPYTGQRKAWANASDPYYREYDSLFQKTLAQVWPGISKLAPYEPDILTGKPMLRSTGGLVNAHIPFETLEENQSPVAQKLIAMNVWHKGNFKSATTGQIYTGEERAQIKALMAKNGLEKALAKHFESKEFKADEQRWTEGSLAPSERLVDPWHKRRTVEIFQDSLNAAQQEVEATNPDFIKRKNEFLQRTGTQGGGVYDLIQYSQQ
jgi:hypothetical protein